MEDDAPQKLLFEQNPQELFDLAPLPYGIMDSEGYILEANEALKRLLVPFEVPVFLPTLVDPGSQDNLNYLLIKASKSNLAQSEELKVLWPGGAQWNLADLRKTRTNKGLFLFILTDIGERKAVDRHLREALQSKELLLRELHHRVKNKLQMISSMISLQASQNANPETTDELKKIQSRVVSLSFLFDLLYGYRYPSQVNLKDMLTEMLGYLSSSFLPEKWQNRWSVQGDDVFLDAPRVLTCGQIIHELVTNVFKHSFPSQENAQIHIATKRTGPRWSVTLEETQCWDPSTADSSKGIGILLVKILTEQLEATLTVSGTLSTIWTLDAPV